MRSWGQRSQAWILAMLVVAAILGAGVAMQQRLGGERPWALPAQRCADLARGCVLKHGAQKIVLRTTAPPRPMEAMTLTVEGLREGPAYLWFAMDGMDMSGLGRHALRVSPAGVARLTLVLPLCVTGRHDWRLHLQQGQQLWLVDFEMDKKIEH